MYRPPPPLEPGASGNAFSSFLPCPPCLPSPASRCLLPALGGQRAGGRCLLLAGKDVLFPAHFSWGPGSSCAAEIAEAWGEAEGGAGEQRPRTEVLPGWSGSGPQIRGPDQVTQWALGRACSYGLLQTTNHRHKSLPGTRTVFTEILPQTHPPTTGKSSKVRMCLMQGVTSWPPPSSFHEHARLTAEDEHRAEKTGWPSARPPHLIAVPLSLLLPPPSTPCCVPFLLPPMSLFPTPLFQVTSSRKPS